VPRVDEIDRVLHAERLAPGGGRQLHQGRLADLPDGTMVAEDDQAWLVLSAHLLAWTPFGYGRRRVMPASATVQSITPPSMQSILRAGYQPGIHPTAERLAPRLSP
jgi:hypothetical protein